MASLPKTFHDVVLITRFLNVQYLWIDSLCIVQDDILDWEVEAAKMASVYAGVYLTIAASGAKDSNGGCFQSFSPTVSISHQNQLWHFRTSGFTSKSHPLDFLVRRGWTFQESALSRRFVSFRPDQMIWTCAKQSVTEAGLEPGPRITILNTPVNIRIGLPKDALDRETPYYSWNILMENYSKRSFTFNKDKLVALAGLIETFQEITHDTPLLGLWKGNIWRDLL
jgi:hypothetical protein